MEIKLSREVGSLWVKVLRKRDVVTVSQLNCNTSPAHQRRGSECRDPSARRARHNWPKAIV